MLEYYKYTDKEMDELIDSIVYLVDKREKKNQNILSYWDKKGIKYKEYTLSKADYSFMIPKNDALGIVNDLYFDKKFVFERKGSLNEISINFTKERDRFKKELAQAPENKIIIIENANYQDIADGNYDTQYNKRSFIASIHSFWHEFNVPFVFMPDNRYTGLFIRMHTEYYVKNLFK